MLKGLDPALPGVSLGSNSQQAVLACGVPCSDIATFRRGSRSAEEAP
jgi:hypothetical protein